VAMAQFVQGTAAVTGGDVAPGLALLDEAMVAAVAGELTPPVTGTIYCGVIEVCQRVAELRRAREWTEALTSWCDSQPDLVTFTGQCLVHRAEILLATGDLGGAREAADELGRIAGDYRTLALVAAADHARGAVRLAEGEAGAAVAVLRGAWRAWRELEAPYEAARARVLIGLACRELGDQDAAAMELAAARPGWPPATTWPGGAGRS
jgi:hypothetical protein